MTNSPNIKTVISQEPYIILNNQGEILPSINLSRPNYKLGRDGQQVDLVVPQHWTVVSRVQACFRRQGDDYFAKIKLLSLSEASSLAPMTSVHVC